MNSKDVTSIALKFFGIYLMVNLVFFVPSMVLAFTTLATFGAGGFGTGSIILVIGGTGMLIAIDNPSPLTVVGTLEPWALRP